MVDSEKIIEYIKRDPYYIKSVENPTEEMCIYAVKKDADAIKYIKNPSNEIIILAVKKDWSYIKHIKNPSFEVQLKAVKAREQAMIYIKELTEEKVRSFLKVNFKVVKYLNKDYEDLAKKIVIEEISKEDVDEDFILDFIKTEALNINKFKFIHKFGSMKAKGIFVDYNLGM
ncbi:hypothetical protein [Clostridium tetani]|uniref:DUF4116 domain-containing protein n=1 Tax=Clostridium tetani TaxID=1513 RepID=A0ABY0ELG3_CLOTA|nr:hypothetical protein [Clostridium tetani]KHO39217.1 hypothetical protein OR62_06925 [Clostridium tetani]RXI51710.1 hypothetical protein DP131_13850 [Clostridium tetani]RXI74065.1 hypothetical protein DQN76_01375 [Clostridium tetani]CDI49440.1 hypothetical protein BN906_01439 [Clostridium tetani 12124569]